MARVPEEARRDFLVEVATLYYEQDLSQAEIARKFDVSRSLVSHLLKLCRDQGIVEIRINDVRSPSARLRRRLCESFGLADAVIVPSSQDVEHTKTQVGSSGASLLEPLLKDNVRIGISWGTTLHRLVAHLRPLPLKGIEVIQLHGGLGSGDPDIDGFGLAQKLAEKLSGSYSIIQAPIVVQSIELREMLMREPRIRDTLTRGAGAGMALFGIGSNLPSISSLVRAGALTEEESRGLVQEGDVGTVCGLHVRADGSVSPGSLNQRLVGITFDSLLRIPVRIGLAAGRDKALAVRAALRGGFVTALVVDEEIADALFSDP